MPELHDLLDRRASGYGPPPDLFERVLGRRRRRDRNRRVGAAVVALAVAAVAIGGLLRSFTSGPVPADEDLGIFTPVAGRIVYANEGIDRGYDPGVWAVDPSGPSDTTEGPGVADDVASTLVRLDLEGAVPLDWSSDGTELLFTRTAEGLVAEEYLFILHADGSVTQLNSDPMAIGGAAISPDGTRVVIADGAGLYVVDAGGGRPVPLPIPSPRDASLVTFSPDGMQIAYLVSGGDVAGGVDEEHVWVANPDGTGAHEILANEDPVLVGVSGLQWSPTGNRLAIGVGLAEGGGRPTIYTFAPDGSGFRAAIVGGISPYWSPDGSQIAYTVPCGEDPDGWCPEGSVLRSEFDPQPGARPTGLAIARAGGITVRVFGFAASGPWQPYFVYGWPDTTRNPAGVYSWDGSRCGSSSPRSSCVMGFMHNAMNGGSGDISIRVDGDAGSIVPHDGTSVTVFGYEGSHLRYTGDPTTGGPRASCEQWMVDIQGTTVTIKLCAKPGAPADEIVEAHEIIESMRMEPQDNDLGFRLNFTLATDTWDSG